MIRDIIRRSIRRIIYGTPIQRWLGFGRSSLSGEDWNKQLSGRLKSYLGGTISIEARNMAVLTLLRTVHPSVSRVLDVGCASGSLLRSTMVRELDYTGIDISSVAIEEARRLSPEGKFLVAQLQDYNPETTYDAIIFSEVLYYLPVEEAISEFNRYAGFLSDNGQIVVSMKRDPKSESIMQAIAARSSWISGLLIQEKADGPGWRITSNAARPAFLIGVFRPEVGAM